MLIRPENIEQQIHDLCRKYAENPNSIILALSAANNDIVNSDSLKFARQIDPQGKRTLCIITKMDLYDGTNKYLKELFSNKIIELNLGFISVSNDSSPNTELLEKYPAFKEFNNFGRDVLLSKLGDLLAYKIRNHIPQLRLNLHKLHKDLERKHQSILLSQSLSSLDINGKGVYLLSLINKFVIKAKDFLEGNYFEIGIGLQGAALINQIIDVNFRKEIMSTNVLDMVTEEDVYNAVKNSNGFKQSLFVSQTAFETLAKHMIVKLKPVSLDCAESVAQELALLFQKVKVDEIEPFPELKGNINTIIGDLIHSRLSPTKIFIENFFEIEVGHINTRHPDFLSSATDSILHSTQDDQKKKDEHTNMTKRERNEIELIKQMLFNYFEVVKKNICDYIPKIVLTLLVHKTIELCERDLISNLYKSDRYDTLLKEKAETAERYAQIKNELKAIKECLKYLNIHK